MRTAREIDQLDLLAGKRTAEAKLRRALIIALGNADGRVLVAFGELLEWVASGKVASGKVASGRGRRS